jgi:hypothetical protein
VDFFLQFTWSFQLHYGPGIESASNRNKYQESSLGVKYVGVADVLAEVLFGRLPNTGLHHYL